MDRATVQMDASLCSVPSYFLKKHLKVSDPSPNQKACKVLENRLNLKKEELRLGSFDAGASRSIRASPY